ncbi:MAG: CPBP family intramembrane glutamic endopeptidase [Clostridium sp.]
MNIYNISMKNMIEKIKIVDMFKKIYNEVKLNRYKLVIITIIIVGLGVLGVLENSFFEMISKKGNLRYLLKYEYWIKSFFKVLGFLTTYLLCKYILKYIKSDDIVNNIVDNDVIKSRGEIDYIKVVLLQLSIILLIIIGYILSLKFISVENILQGSISKNITKSNYIYVYTYIILFNSLFEELFFRGFIYLKLSNLFKYSGIISAICFSIYHIAILYKFVVWYQIILLVIGLFIVGMFFNILDKNSQTIIPSYLVHASANFAINIVTALLIFF